MEEWTWDWPRLCCGRPLSRVVGARLVAGTTSFGACIFTAGALGAPAWASVSLSSASAIGTDDTTVTWGLWRQFSEGRDADDRALRRGRFERGSQWDAVELNRAATILALVVNLSLAAYYLTTAICFHVPAADVALGGLLVFLGVLAWRGADDWSDELQTVMDDRRTGGLEASYERPCDAGCGLARWNGFMYLVLGFSLIYMGPKDIFYPDDTYFCYDACWVTHPPARVTFAVPATDEEADFTIAAEVRNVDNVVDVEPEPPVATSSPPCSPTC